MYYGIISISALLFSLVFVFSDKYREKYGSNLLEKNTDVEVLSSIEQNLIEKKSTLYTTKSQNAQGGELWIQTNLTPIFDNQDNLYKIVAIDSDITQIKKAEEEIAAQKDKIVESIRYAQKIQQAVMPEESIPLDKRDDWDW